MSEVIEIVASNPDWPRMFEEERVSLLPLIGQYVEDIQHTGSTSVLRLAAKSVIDILIAVRALALVEKCVGPLEWAHKKEVKVDAFAFFFGGVRFSVIPISLSCLFAGLTLMQAVWSYRAGASHMARHGCRRVESDPDNLLSSAA